MNFLKRITQGFLLEEAGEGGGGGSSSSESSAGEQNAGSTLLNQGTTTEGEQSADSSTSQSSESSASGTPEPFKLNVYDDDGNLSEAFVKSVPEDQKGVIAHFKKYKTTEDALKGLQHMSKRAMQAEVQPLGPNATDAEIAEHQQMVKTALGIPETAADYTLQLPEGIDKDAVDTAFVDELKTFAHENNVTPEAFNKFAPILMQREAAIHQQYQQQEAALLDDGKAALGKLWGDEAPAKLQAATNAVALVDPDINPAEDPAFKHATTIRLAEKIAELTANDSRPNGSSGAAPGGAGNYREQSLAIVNDPNNQWHAAYHNEKDSQHAAAVAEKQRLSKLAHQHGQV